MMSSDFSERDVHLAIDGELTGERRREFDAWLETEPEQQLRAALFEADRERLRSALAEFAYEPLPDHITRTLLGAADDAPPAPAEGGLSAWWKGAAAAMLLLAAAAAGYGFGAGGTLRQQAAVPDPLAERAVIAHRIYAAEKLHMVEVGADQKDHLQSWLSRRIGRSLTAPDLTSEGFSLIGGRLLPSGERVAAQFMYQDESGNRISLYITPTNERDTGFRRMDHDGARAFFWVDDGYGYALAGSITESTIQQAARHAYRQLL